MILGTSDVAGSRISISMMAAEELGIPVDKVRAVMADTHSLGFNRVTAGSRHNQWVDAIRHGAVDVGARFNQAAGRFDVSLLSSEQ